MSSFNCTECNLPMTAFKNIGYPVGCGCGKGKAEPEALEEMLLMALYQIKGYSDNDLVVRGNLHYSIDSVITLIENLRKEKRDRLLEQLNEAYAEMGQEDETYSRQMQEELEPIEPLDSKIKLYDETQVPATGFHEPCSLCDSTGITYVYAHNGNVANMPCPRCSEW
tara:strand:+ start:3239 stop:3739 length:501 start_codon:yes stop_codon:yes gene_type:complete